MIHAYCSICQESFNNKSEISAFKCGHVFHYNCISQWMKTNSSCPNCRCLGIDNFIKRIYFDQVSEINRSFANSSQEDVDEERSELRSEIARMKMEISEITNQNTDLSIKNSNFIKEISQIKTSQHNDDFNYSNAIDAKDREITRYKNKIHTLRFINDVLNKSEDKVQSKIESLRVSGNVQAETESLCSSIVLLKKEVEFFKQKTDELSKSLSVSEMENRILDNRLQGSLQRSACGPEGPEEVFKTPIRARNVDKDPRVLTTPQRLAAGSPVTPSSLVKRRLNQEAVRANPFGRGGGAQKRPKCDLSSLTIMQSKAPLWSKRSL